MTVKDDLHSIAASLVASDPEWTFRPSYRGRALYVNHSLGFAEKIIDPCFTFVRGNAFIMDPLVAVRSKKTPTIYRKIFGTPELYTSWIRFQSLIRPFKKWVIYRERFDLPGQSDVWETSFRTFEQLPSMIEDVLRVGEAFLNDYYNFSSEDALLRSLPVVTTATPGSSTLMMISQCIGRIAIGDYEFVRNFDRSKFIVHAEKFDKVIAALPSFEEMRSGGLRR